MRAAHETHSVWKVFTRDHRPHIGRDSKTGLMEPDMNATPAISRWMSLATLGAFAGVLFLLAFAPAPSLYAG